MHLSIPDIHFGYGGYTPINLVENAKDAVCRGSGRMVLDLNQPSYVRLWLTCLKAFDVEDYSSNPVVLQSVSS